VNLNTDKFHLFAQPDGIGRVAGLASQVHDVLQGYVRNAEGFKDHSGAGLL
jgi:hypothetical protein